MITNENYYADRVTMMFAAGHALDALTVHEVTIEPTAREFESVDFETIAWCPDDESAQLILAALRMAAANKVMLTALNTLVGVAYPFTTYDSDDESGLGVACKAAHAAIKQVTGD